MVICGIGHADGLAGRAAPGVDRAAEHGRGQAANGLVPVGAVVAYLAAGDGEPRVQHLVGEQVVHVAGTAAERGGEQRDARAVLPAGAGEAVAVAVGRDADDDGHLGGKLRVERGPDAGVGVVGADPGIAPQCGGGGPVGNCHVVSIAEPTTD